MRTRRAVKDPREGAWSEASSNSDARHAAGLSAEEVPLAGNQTKERSVNDAMPPRRQTKRAFPDVKRRDAASTHAEGKALMKSAAKDGRLLTCSASKDAS